MPTFFDEAGHRVATQYLFAVLHGKMAAERLLEYRVGHEGLPGHPELGLTEGIDFSASVGLENRPLGSLSRLFDGSKSLRQLLKRPEIVVETIVPKLVSMQL